MLVVEDDDDIREALMDILESVGYPAKSIEDPTPLDIEGALPKPLSLGGILQEVHKFCRDSMAGGHAKGTFGEV